MVAHAVKTPPGQMWYGLCVCTGCQELCAITWPFAKSPADLNLNSPGRNPGTWNKRRSTRKGLNNFHSSIQPLQGFRSPSLNPGLRPGLLILYPCRGISFYMPIKKARAFQMNMGRGFVLISSIFSFGENTHHNNSQKENW